jgi:2'-5' RNA ligase
VNEGNIQRLFFALWPDDEFRARLVNTTGKIRQILADNGARPVSTDNLHITLAFLGNVASDIYPCVIRAADGVSSAPGFSVDLDHYGFFRRAGVCYLAAADLPAELEELVTRLSQSLRCCGYDPENRRFRPHMTLARKIAKKPELGAPGVLRWRLRDFVLVSSETRSTGPVYRVLQRWPLSIENPGNAAE